MHTYMGRRRRRVLPTIVSMLAAALLAPTATARVIYVKWDATGANNGTSWANAFFHLQDGLAASVSGDEIWVARGVYKPDRGTGQTPGARTATFRMKSGIEVFGGFGGWEATLGERNPALHIAILSGDLAGNDVGVSNNSENSFHVVTIGNLGANLVLDGLHILGGNADGPGWMYDDYESQAFGGGMQIVRSSPTIRNCVFSFNRARWGGGALLAFDNASFRLEQCRFENNESAFWAGGIFCCGGQSNPQVLNCVFAANIALEGAAVLNGGGAESTFVNCAFVGNRSEQSGGALHICSGRAPRWINCTFYGNRQNQRSGAGVFVYHADPLFENCIFWHNRDRAGTGSDAQIHNANPAVNTPVVNYSIVEGGWYGAGGAGNLTTDPMLADADGPDNVAGTSDDDLRLRSGSPATDSGSNLAVPPGVQFDLIGLRRFVDDPKMPDKGVGAPPIVDIGACEHAPESLPGDANCDGVFDFYDIDPFVLGLLDPAGFKRVFPNCNFMNLDMNADGRVDNFDIDPFVAALFE